MPARWGWEYLSPHVSINGGGSILISRAYRVAWIDVGCLTQTFQLVTTGFGLDLWPTGYFFDREVNQLLQVDGVNEAALFFLGAGNGTGSPFYPPVPELLERLQPLIT